MDLDPEFISVAQLASFAIHPLGHDIEIGLVDSEDRRFILKLHPDALAVLFALIPQMLGRALERLNGKDGAQQVFSLDGWTIDPVNDGAASVLTLCGADSFRVSFLADACAVEQLALALQQAACQAERRHAGVRKH